MRQAFAFSEPSNGSSLGVATPVGTVSYLRCCKEEEPTWRRLLWLGCRGCGVKPIRMDLHVMNCATGLVSEALWPARIPGVIVSCEYLRQDLLLRTLCPECGVIDWSYRTERVNT